ncbi:MAG TPA: hypothetical protein VEU33_44395 [Archangium sp.]|nr:hypothetical protein [Archangium sp.]
MDATDKKLLAEIDTHLQLAAASGKVIYLEDKTDAKAFLALLGVVEPPGQDLLHQGGLVLGLSDSTLGRGNKSVRRRVELTQALRGYSGVVGVVDGDGIPLSTLVAQFDPPFSGRLYSWKAYSIENLIAKVSWPPAWGAAPKWPEVLLEYAPYAAFNRLILEIQAHLRALGFGQFMTPTLDGPLLLASDVITALETQQPNLARYEAANRFSTLLGEIESSIRSGTDEGHAVINGKWLFEDYAPRRTKLKREDCRNTWIEHVRSTGGLSEVRDFWKRVTGNNP